MNRLYFGIDIQAQLQQWWEEEYLPHIFFPTHGKGAEILVLVLDPAVPVWNHFIQPIIGYRLATGEGARYDGPEGLAKNVRRKLRFCLRSDGIHASLVAEKQPDLLEPGDFPYEGAGEWDGYWGGASGLPNGSDDFSVFVNVIGKLRKLRAAAVAPAIRACEDRVPGWKYLDGEGTPLEPLPSWVEAPEGTTEPAD